MSILNIVSPGFAMEKAAYDIYSIITTIVSLMMIIFTIFAIFLGISGWILRSAQKEKNKQYWLGSAATGIAVLMILIAIIATIVHVLINILLKR